MILIYKSQCIATGNFDKIYFQNLNGMCSWTDDFHSAHRLAVAFSRLMILKSQEGSSSRISITSAGICDSKLLGMWIWWPDTENQTQLKIQLPHHKSNLQYSWYMGFSSIWFLLPGLLCDTLLLSCELVISCLFTFCWNIWYTKFIYKIFFIIFNFHKIEIYINFIQKIGL